MPQIESKVSLHDQKIKMSQHILKCIICGGPHSIFHCTNKCGVCSSDTWQCSCAIDLFRRRRKGLYSPPPNIPCLIDQATRSCAGYTTTCSGSRNVLVWRCKTNRSSTKIRRSWKSQIKMQKSWQTLSGRSQRPSRSSTPNWGRPRRRLQTLRQRWKHCAAEARQPNGSFSFLALHIILTNN